MHNQHFLQLSKDVFLLLYLFKIFSSFQYSLRTSKGLKLVPNPKSASIDPSCTPSMVYRALGLRACLELNPFRSIQLGSRPSYPITVSLRTFKSISKNKILSYIDNT
jgi:hypothetical protein